jgi:predicted nuclease of predicted toxin-antitoxin system
MKLLLDANLSWRLIKLLEEVFPDVIHINSTSLNKPVKDYEIWKFAKDQNRVIVTNDEDFYHLAITKGFPPKVVILRFGNQHPQQIANTLKNHKQDIQALIDSTETGILEIL